MVFLMKTGSLPGFFIWEVELKYNGLSQKPVFLKHLLRTYLLAIYFQVLLVLFSKYLLNLVISLQFYCNNANTYYNDSYFRYCKNQVTGLPHLFLPFIFKFALHIQLNKSF